jgi:hypothetical protein
LSGKSRERETISQQEESCMKRFLGLAIGLFSVIGFMSSAEAITITLAEVQNGLAVVQGNKAAKSAIITWDRVSVTQTSKGGSFSFSATVPADCVGTLSDGTSTIDVVVLDCTPVSTAPAPVPQTGQTLCYDSTGATVTCAGTGQDGALQKGVVWPNPRFTDNNNGTITDNLTGLIWLKNANCFGLRSWAQALSDANGLASSSCGLTDGSVAGDWRLPNINELASLVDFGTFEPALPSGNPFAQFQVAFYWSSTTYANRSYALIVEFADGLSNIGAKTAGGQEYYVIAVRGGS